MILAVCFHAWRRHRNLAQQPCNYNGWTTANRRLSVAVDGRKIKRELWGTKSSQWCHPKPLKISTEQSGKVAGFSSFGRQRSGCFSITWTAGVWWPDFKPQIGTKLGRWSGRNRKIWPSQFRVKQVGFLGRFWQLLSHSLTRVYVTPFPASSFTF